MDLDELLGRAKSGDLADRDVQLAIEALGQSSSDRDTYTLVHVLGISQDESARPVLEGALLDHDRPQVAGLALRSLCRWQGARRYRDVLQAFLEGCEWDDVFDSARMFAVQAAGDYLRAHLDADLLRQIIAVAEDVEEDESMRLSALGAIANVVGLSPRERIRFAFPRALAMQDQNAALLDRARKLLE